MPQPAPASVPKSPLDDLPFAFARATLGFRKFNDLSLRAVGLESLAPGLASVLHALEELGACTVTQLVDCTQLPNGTLTGLLDTLERQGSIERTRNPDDGRSRIIALTPAGNALCSRLRERHGLVMKHLSEGMHESELAALTLLLRKLTFCMHAYDPTFHRGAPVGEFALNLSNP